MQNFSNSPAPPTLPPGFSGRGVGGPSYPPQPTEPQISPRMTDDYVGMQQQSMHRGLPHPGQASHMLSYSARSRGVLEPTPTQGNIHSGGGSNNPYRKDAMDYYFSMGGKDRHRRGGMSYAGGFGYPGIDGHISHQYRHPGPSSAPSSGLMSPYPVDYASSVGSCGGAGAFSPSHQYSMNQSPSMQPVPGAQMQHRQHGQNFTAVHHGQQHRSYPHSGHRMTPQYPQYSPQGGASTGSSGMYSPPLQRYLDGAANTGFDPKVNSSPSVNSSLNSVSSSVAANNVGLTETVPQSYHTANYPGYSPQSLHKQATLQHRNSQHSLGPAYDTPLKMQHQGPSPSSAYVKHHQASSTSITQPASQDIAKSPMNPSAQQTQINQNFSPISNPSPAASALHSPSCSSSPSPLMGIPDAHANPPGLGSSHPPSSNPRSSHSQGRLLQTMPQLSPTPNSNSSISSSGSSGSHKAVSVTSVGGSSLPPTGRSKMSRGVGIASREEYSASALDKMQDAGLNSLNALSSQVANIPNTVQHMLLTNTVLSQKKKDMGQMQPGPHTVPQSLPRSRNESIASSASTVKDGSVAGTSDGATLDVGVDEDFSLASGGTSSGTKMEREEQLSEGEHQRVRQMSGASSGSETNCYSQTQTGEPLNIKSSDIPPRETSATETELNEANVPSPSSPSFRCQTSENAPTQQLSSAGSSSTAFTVSSIPPSESNCVSQSGMTYNDNSGGEIKTENETAVEKTQKVSSQMQQDAEVNIQSDQDKENRLHFASNSHSNKKKDKCTSEEQQNTSGVGVIVSARSEGSHAEKRKHHQDNCVEEKQPHSRESSSHNGEEGVDLSLYSSHHPKSNSGRSQNPPQSAPHKYSYPESTYGSDLSMKSRVRPGPAGGMEPNPRYLGYQQSQIAYGPMHPKESGSVAEALVKRGQGAGPKGQEENSQMQPFQSLLQEVLQGYNLDRRYGRPEQAFPAHHQTQQQFSGRHQFGMTEGTRMQSGLSEGSAYSAHMDSSGKPPNQRHGNEAIDLQSSVKTEVSNAKVPQNIEKTEAGVSHSHLLQESQHTPPKHINLADYSLPHKKVLCNFPTTSSAVQELLLQEPEPITGSIGQSEAQKSSGSTLAPSERRSVICDVSPKRRSTPERDREGGREKSQSGASVIQQQFSSPAAANDLSKKDPKEKQVRKIEAASKEAGMEAVNVQAKHHSSSEVSETDVEYPSKSAHSSAEMAADPFGRSSVDMNPMASHSVSTNPLSSPSRHQSYLHGVDLSTSSSRTFPGFRYGDTREGSMRSRNNPHFPSHHPYQHLPPQPQATNKLHMYPHPRGLPHHPHEMSDWVKAMNRPSKEMMIMQPGSSPGRHKASQSEQRQQGTDMPSEQLAGNASLHHQSGYYDMKMWDSAHSGGDCVRMMEGDSYYRMQPSPSLPPPSSAPRSSHGPVPPKIPHSQNAAEPEVSKSGPEEAKHPCQPPFSSSTKLRADTNSTHPPSQLQRHTKAGVSGDTNPLMLRRRVRSFISPIPAKRQLQDSSQQRVTTNLNHSPTVKPEPSHHQEDDPSSSDMPCPRLSSPLAGETTFSQPLSPSSGHTKAIPSRKGRGLKLEAIVQKITPNIKKPVGHTDDESNHYPGFQSEIAAFSDPQEPDLGHFSRAAGGDDSYMEESHSLNEMIPFRGVDDTLAPPAYTCEPHQTPQVIKQDFDFGLGAAVASASGDKEDFALLGPLPPPPPLPRPVQGSPPPSSSALSDIQHFTNTYQQLETRRGEQSAANLLRQKLQETGMGFDDYPGSDYYGTTPPHQGHMLNRQHQMSQRSSLSPQDSKPLENLVPKGYFPSGKKKGRPVGSVNKQKRAQNQVQTQAQAPVQMQNTTPSAPQAPPVSTPAAPTLSAAAQPASSSATPTAPALPESESTPPPDPPVLTQVVKADVESEDTLPEGEVKAARRRRRGVKDEPSEARGRQRRRRRVAVPPTPSVAKDDPDEAVGGGGIQVFLDPNRRGPFIPHIHVEKKVPEIGAVCTIVNAEEDKMKGERSAGGGKASGSGIDSLLTSALSSQVSRRDRETEKRDTDEVETTLQTGKALPSSGYVVSGPVITESNHSGRLLCCLCQKWANYKHLGDLYGPYYPAEYAAKLPKNQPQIRQGQASTGRTGPNSDTSSNASSTNQDTKPHSVDANSLDLNLTPAVSTASPAGTEELMFMASKLFNATSSSSSSSSSSTVKTSVTWDANVDSRPIPELKREPDVESEPQQSQKQPTDEAQQRAQHRKLTSHPRFKRRHKSREDSPRMVPSNSKASLPFQPPPPALDSLGPLAQLAQLPQMPLDPEELWVHEGCIVWTSGVYLVNGRLYGLQEALDGARETSCSYCEMLGSTLGCYSKGCTLRYHYLCAIEADCALNEDNFSLRCPKHKFIQSLRPAKAVEQSERG